MWVNYDNWREHNGDTTDELSQEERELINEIFEELRLANWERENEYNV